MKLSPTTRRRWLGVVGLIALLLSYPAWTSWRVYRSVNQARQLLTAFDPDGAVRVLEPLAGVDRADVHYWLAVSLRRAKKFDAYPPHLARAAELGWPHEDIRRQQFLARAQTGQMDQVERSLPEFLPEQATDEATDEICEALVMGYLTDYRLDDALSWLARWRVLRPDSAQPWLLFGELMTATSKDGGAATMVEDAFKQALLRDPKNLRARLLLSDTAFRSGKYHEAEAGYTAALAAAPNDPAANLGLAQTLVQLGESGKAGELFSRSLSLPLSRDQKTTALVELGSLRLAEGDVEGAYIRLNEAVQNSPIDHKARYKLMQCLQRAGRSAEAEVQLKIALQNEELTKKFQERREALIRSPQDLDIHCELGDLALRVGEHEEGKKWLYGVLKRDPQHRLAHQRLLRYFEESGDAVQADRHRAVLERLPPETAVSAQKDDSSDEKDDAKEESKLEPDSASRPETSSPDG